MRSAVAGSASARRGGSDDRLRKGRKDARGNVTGEVCGPSSKNSDVGLATMIRYFDQVSRVTNLISPRSYASYAALPVEPAPKRTYHLTGYDTLTHLTAWIEGRLFT
jgi:hypothetical protein